MQLSVSGSPRHFIRYALFLKNIKEIFMIVVVSPAKKLNMNLIKDLKVSSHLYIKRTGEIIQFVPFNMRAWHAGDSSYKGVRDCNNYSIGIELEGTDRDNFSNNQYEKLIQISKQIIKNYPEINKDKIVGHSEISPGRKTDPGHKFEWNRYLNAL